MLQEMEEKIKKGDRETTAVLEEARKSFFLGFFQEYIEKGIFRADMGNDFYERTFEQIFIISDNWIKYLELEETEENSIEVKIDHYINLFLSLLLPALSETN